MLTDTLTDRASLLSHYLSLGWAVFPLGAGKRPLANCDACRDAGPGHDAESCSCLTCHGFYAASNDPERVELMFSMHPDAPIGLRTGVASSVIVLDAEAELDSDDIPTGLTVLDHFQDYVPGVELPHTMTALSQNGGVHLFYRHVVGVGSHNRVLPGLDIKGDGGYVVLPSGDGPRAWVAGNTVVEPAPEPLCAWLRAARGRGGGATPGSIQQVPDGYDFRSFSSDGCPDGFRDYFFNDLAFRLRREGMTRADAERVALVHYGRIEQPPIARFFMPWKDVLYKLDRVWQSVGPDADRDEAHEAAWIASLPGQRAELHATHVAVTENDHRLELPTDRGNAERFVRVHGKDLRYLTAQRRWLVWDGNRWRRDDLDRVNYLARTVADDVRTLAEKCNAEGRTDDAKRWADWALKCESYRAIQAVVKLAASDPHIALLPDAADADRMLLAVRNGVIDLRTGSLREVARNDHLTRMADVEYAPEATCPGWLAHVELVTSGDHTLGRFLQRCAGYTLTGLIDAQAFFLLEGDGANGKSAFMETLIALMGDYANVSSSALLTGGDEQHPTILADLAGARLVYVDEARQGKPINAERIKALTGSSKVSARRMGQDFFQFSPQLKLWIAGNAHPSMRDSSDGIWRRMQRILFRAKIPADHRIADYGRVLHEQEAAGILNWALAGLTDWLATGQLDAPELVRLAVTEVRDEEDQIAQFIEEVCLIGDGYSCASGEVYLEYTMWAGLAGVHAGARLSRVEFGRQLAAKGFERWQHRVDGRITRGFEGIGICR